MQFLSEGRGADFRKEHAMDRNCRERFVRLQNNNNRVKKFHNKAVLFAFCTSGNPIVK
jgi:hypothetical protein